MEIMSFQEFMVNEVVRKKSGGDTRKSFKDLVPGDKITLTYRNNGIKDFDGVFNGFTDDSEKYGSGGVKFKTQKEMLSHYNVSSLKALKELQDKNEYGRSSYMVIDGTPIAYISNGRWSVGSGANPVTLVDIQK